MRSFNPDSDDDKSNCILNSQSSLDFLNNRYFSLYSDHIRIDGKDGLTHKLDPITETLERIHFPKSFLQGNDIDLSVTLHEMGHFITVTEARCVRDAFGFKPGVPDLNFQSWIRQPTKVNSAVVEAKAIAWELILRRDLFGLEIDIREETSSLRYASDFSYYEGSNEAERIDWVASLVSGFMNEYDNLKEFDQLWAERCARLPILFDREKSRLRALTEEGKIVQETENFLDDWKATIIEHPYLDTAAYSVLLDNEDAADATWEDFDTLHQANKWLDAVSRYHQADDSSPAIRMRA